MTKDPQMKPDIVRQASDLVKAKLATYRARLGDCGQGRLALAVGLPKSSVGEYLKADKTVIPSPPVVGRIAEKLGINPEEKDLLRQAYEEQKERAAKILRDRRQSGQISVSGRGSKTHKGAKVSKPSGLDLGSKAQRQLALLWQVFGPIAQLVGPRGVTLESVYAHFRAHCVDEGGEFVLSPETFNATQLSVEELRKLTAHTRRVLEQAKGCLALLAQIEPHRVREETLQRIGAEATALWQTFQLAHTLIPEELLRDMRIGQALTRKFQGDKDEDSDR